MAGGSVTYTKDVARDLAEELPGVPPRRPDRADAAADLRRRGRLGGHDQGSRERKADAAVARRPEVRPLFQRPQLCRRQTGKTLLGWIEQGCPRGDDQRPAGPRSLSAGWSIGKPDVVFTMEREFDVPARHRVAASPTSISSVDPNFTEDRWIRRRRPGRATGGRASHHRVSPCRADRKRERSEDGIGNGFLVGYAPGDMPLICPPGTAQDPEGLRAALPDALHAQRQSQVTTARPSA